MKLTDEVKSEIDGMTYQRMLAKWRFAAIGHPMFQGESGDYFAKRMNELRAQPGGDSEHVRSSKAIGW